MHFKRPKDGPPSHYENFWLDSVSNAVLVRILVKSHGQIKAAQKSVLPICWLAGITLATWPISTILTANFFYPFLGNQEANAHLSSELIEIADNCT